MYNHVVMKMTKIIKMAQLQGIYYNMTRLGHQLYVFKSWMPYFGVVNTIANYNTKFKNQDATNPQNDFVEG